MAKNTDYCFTHTDSGSDGTMICSTCKEKIENSKYLVYKKWVHGDWGFITHHTSCALLTDSFAIKYGEQLKEEVEEKVKKEKKLAGEKRGAVKLINSSHCVEILDSHDYDCDIVILIHTKEGK